MVVKDLVDQVRIHLPRLGTKKVFHLIKQDLKFRSIKMGRDKLFDLMRAGDLLIKPRRRYVTTTDSNHWLKKYPNLIKGLEITRPEQVWVSDITYVKTDEGNLYLSLVTDAYSRKIMGYKIADNMDATTVGEAFKMAIKNRCHTSVLIHHSDRGSQYCSKEYVEIAHNQGIIMSMTENGDPYENALAERMNKMIKEEFFPAKSFKTKNQAIKLTSEAVKLYNNYRPHLALKLKTPDWVHEQKIPAA